MQATLYGHAICFNLYAMHDSIAVVTVLEFTYYPSLSAQAMSESLRIAVADDEPIMLEYYRKSLHKMGHEVVVEASTGQQLVDECLAAKPDLVITDIRMPQLDGIAASEKISQQLPVPVILVSAFHDKETVDRATGDHVLAFLIKPIKQADLEVSIAIVLQRHREMRALQQESDDLREALQARKLIERAKGALMKRAGLEEPEAFRRLQKMARDKNLKLVDVAQTILVAEEAFQDR